MKGGDEWINYCPACGLPFGLLNVNVNINDYNWMYEGFGISIGESKHKKYHLYDPTFIGTIYINSNNSETDKKEFGITPFKNGQFSKKYIDKAISPEYGPVIHKKCMEYIRHSIRRELTLNDMVFIAAMNCKNKNDVSTTPISSNNCLVNVSRLLLYKDNILRGPHSAPAAGGHRKPRRLIRKTRKLNKNRNKNRKSKKQRKTRSKK